MSWDQEQSTVRQLLSENQRLKQRVFELEEKVRKSGGAVATATSGNTSVLKLIEHKDFQLQQYTARLEEKKEQLEEASQALSEKSAEVALWASALRHVQELVEREPSALIGVNRAGKILLLNHGAAAVFGERVRDLLRQPVDLVDFQAFDPETPRKVKEVLATGKPAESSVVVRDRRVQTSIHPVGGGALVHIQVAAK